MKIDKLFPAALALSVLAVAPAIAAPSQAQKGEAKLARIIDGRTAGQPVECLDAFKRRHMEVVDHTALVFRDGDTIYVNRPVGAEFLTWNDIPVFKIWGSNQLCSKDMAELRDRSTGMRGAAIVLGEFVPYRRKG